MLESSQTKNVLRCISPEEAQYILATIHEGVCWNHYNKRALVRKVVRVRSYWPHALKDVEEFIRKCLKCRFYTLVPHFPQKELTSIMPPWTFTMGNQSCPRVRGLRGHHRRLLYQVGEGRSPSNNHMTNNIIRFLRKAIICIFGIPHSIISGKGR